MIDAVGIVIPVHNEADYLRDCLHYIDIAEAALPLHIQTTVVVVLDACSDASETIATLWANAEPTFTNGIRRPKFCRTIVTGDFRNVGRARAVGMQTALATLENHRSSRIWLATSDADSAVPETWLTAQLAFAEDGIEAIAGSIVVRDWSDYSPRLAERFRQFYDECAQDHVHGANFGLRADAYRLAGGFEPLATGEDHALWRALHRVARPRMASRAIAVTTSGRRHGRAPAGFSGFLADLEHNE